MSNSPETGLLTIPSSLSVEDTVSQVIQELNAAGMSVFARIDHQENARAVGLSLRPTVVLIFGNPKMGTPLMQAYPSLAIDLPSKALVWQDAEGRVWLSTNDPNYLQRRHGMVERAFEAIPRLLRRAVETRSDGD
jgi:uncharacterized protein (DUF302 family)